MSLKNETSLDLSHFFVAMVNLKSIHPFFFILQCQLFTFPEFAKLRSTFGGLKKQNFLCCYGRDSSILVYIDIESVLGISVPPLCSFQVVIIEQKIFFFLET